MGWTTPRDYEANEVLTAAVLNVDHRDNLDVLSSHVHSGAAGMGSSSLANLVKATYTDASAPSAPGSGLTAIYTVSGRPHYRAGSGGSDTTLAILADVHAQTHASAHQPGGGDAMAVDAATSTASLRTLGTGSTQGAAGNHSHAAVEETAGVSADNAGSTSETYALGDAFSLGGVGAEHTVVTATITPAVACRVWLGAVVVWKDDTAGSISSGTIGLYLSIDGNVVDSIIRDCTATDGNTFLDSLEGEYTVASGSRNVNIEFRTVGGNNSLQGDYIAGITYGSMKGV